MSIVLALLQKRDSVPVGKPPLVSVFTTGIREAALIENKKKVSIP